MGKKEQPFVDLLSDMSSILNTLIESYKITEHDQMCTNAPKTKLKVTIIRNMMPQSVRQPGSHNKRNKNYSFNSQVICFLKSECTYPQL